MEKPRSLDAIAKDATANLKTDVKGKVALGIFLKEAREQLPDNKEFGNWCSEMSSEQLKTRTIHNYMSLAVYEDRDLGNIPLTGFISLASKQNEDVFETVYEILVKRPKVKVSDVERAIADEKNKPSPAYSQALSVIDELSVERVAETLGTYSGANRIKCGTIGSRVTILRQGRRFLGLKFSSY